MRMYRSLPVGIAFVFAAALLTGCQPTQEKSVSTEPGQLKMEVQQAADDAASDSTEVSILEVEKTVHDFGEMGPGASKKCEFSFKNTGTEILKIGHVQSTCGCTVPQLKKKEYVPGESGTIKVTFKSPSTKGKVNKHLYIVSNDPKQPRFELGIKAKVVVKVEISPENVELRLDKDNAGMPDIVVKSLDDREFSIKSITIGRDAMQIDSDPTQKAKEFTLRPVVDKNRLNDFNTGVIQVKTDHPQAGTLVVRYNAVPAYEVSRPQIILQNVDPGVAIVKDVIIRSNYGTPVEIDSVASRNGYMEVENQKQDGEHLKLQVKIVPPDRGPKKYLTDELKFNLLDGNKLSIKCSGWFKK